MNSTSTTMVVHETEDALLGPNADLSAFLPKTEEELNTAALADPDAQPLELLIAHGWRKGVNVRKLRARLGMTQEEFAKTYWIPLGTLRDWEQRRKNADQTALAYLKVIDQDPKVIAALLGNK